MHFSPQEAADRLGVTVQTDRLNHAYGYADGTGTIWLDDRLTPTEARCVLTHELLHIIHGHVGEQPPHIEQQIHAATARWLVPWPYLLAAIGDQITPHDMAESLGVTVEVLHHRLVHATPAELATLTMEGGRPCVPTV
jgi:Zn-dependent peptidase ImmA (M78 family)